MRKFPGILGRNRIFPTQKHSNAEGRQRPNFRLGRRRARLLSRWTKFPAVWGGGRVAIESPRRETRRAGRSLFSRIPARNARPFGCAGKAPRERPRRVRCCFIRMEAPPHLLDARALAHAWVRGDPDDERGVDRREHRAPNIIAAPHTTPRRGGRRVCVDFICSNLGAAKFPGSKYATRTDGDQQRAPHSEMKPEGGDIAASTTALRHRPRHASNYFACRAKVGNK